MRYHYFVPVLPILRRFSKFYVSTECGEPQRKVAVARDLVAAFHRLPSFTKSGCLETIIVCMDFCLLNSRVVCATHTENGDCWHPNPGSDSDAFQWRALSRFHRETSSHRERSILPGTQVGLRSLCTPGKAISVNSEPG